MLGGTFTLNRESRNKPRGRLSHATFAFEASHPTAITGHLKAIQPHGAIVETEQDCTVAPAPPMGFYLKTFTPHLICPPKSAIREHWLDVDQTEMDLAIVVKPSPPSATMIPMGSVKKGDLVVTGRREGIRVFPLERPAERDVFGFHGSTRFLPNVHHRHIIAEMSPSG